MSNTRQETKLGLKDNTWTKVNTHLAKIQAEDQPAVHCRIPLCIGFKESIGGNELLAIIEDVTNKGYDYTIYLSPKDDSSLGAWMQKNAEALSFLPSEKIMEIREWRKGAEWLRAQAAYQDYSQGDKKDIANRMVQADKFKFHERNKDVHEDEIEQHIISEVIDVLSWMSPQDARPEEMHGKQLSVLLYAHRLSQAMYNVIQNAALMGFDMESIQHAMYDFEAFPVPQNRRRLYESAGAGANGLSNPQQEMSLVEKVVLTFAGNGTDTRYAARFVADLYTLLNTGNTFTLSLPVNPALHLQAVDVDVVPGSQPQPVPNRDTTARGGADYASYPRPITANPSTLYGGQPHQAAARRRSPSESRNPGAGEQGSGFSQSSSF